MGKIYAIFDNDLVEMLGERLIKIPLKKISPSLRISEKI
jgi:hypothetical protein